MDPKKVKQLQDDLRVIMDKYGLDGFCGIVITAGQFDGGVVLYDPKDWRSKLLTCAVNSKLVTMMETMTGKKAVETTGFSGYPGNADKN